MFAALGDFFGTLFIIVGGFIGIMFALIAAGLLFLGGC